MIDQPCKEGLILVTGGAGYIGSQLIRDVVTDPNFANHTIRIYDNLQRQRFSGLMDLPTNGCYEFIEGDILDRLNLARAMQGATAVIHLAAMVRTPLSFEHPEWTEQVNHWGTATVVECALSAGVSRLLYASSASVYGAGEVFREGDTCHPVGPYAISKLRAEEEVLQGCKRGLQATIVRLGTAFGNAPSMRFDAIASRSVYLVGVGRPIIVHGTGEQVRPLIHIRDSSAALRLCLAKVNITGEIINAVTLNPTVNDIVRTLQTIVPTATVRYTDQELLTDISFAVDSTKLLNLGFQPCYDLEHGLREMLARWRGFQPALKKSSIEFGE